MSIKETIVRQLEQAFRRKSWHGTNLLGSIRGIDPETAEWRPAPDRHNIHELIVHCAYWKYSVYRRLAGDPSLKFPVKGSNWIERTEDDLGGDIALLKHYHELLVQSVNAFPEDLLQEIPARSTTTYLDLVIGAAAHDLYHAGQIQLIKRLRSTHLT